MTTSTQRAPRTGNPSLERLKSAIISASGQYAVEAAKKTPDEARKHYLLERVFTLSQKYKELTNGK